MVSRIRQWTLDVEDVQLMAAFWSAVLGYRVDMGDDGGAKLDPPDGSAAGDLSVWLQPSAGPKQKKNRNHPDLRLTHDGAGADTDGDGDVDREVHRILDLGARRIDVGQTGTEPFVVLADPEGNEFCILRREP